MTTETATEAETTPAALDPYWDLERALDLLDCAARDVARLEGIEEEVLGPYLARLRACHAEVEKLRRAG